MVDGAFTARVKLVPGQNVVSAVVRTADGRSATTSVTVTHAPAKVEDEGWGCAGGGAEVGLLGMLLVGLARRRGSTVHPA